MLAATASFDGISLQLYAANVTAAAARQHNEPPPQLPQPASAKVQHSPAAPARGRLQWRRLAGCEEGGCCGPGGDAAVQALQLAAPNRFQ